MLSLPKNTEYNKRVPKTKFYQTLNLPNKIKQQFVDEIDTIIWKNKISEDTIGISKGKDVIEIEVFEVKLHQKGINENLLEIIDRGIPYHTVFVLAYDNKAQIVIGYKERTNIKDDKYKVDKYYYSDWFYPDKFALELKGLNLDSIYETLIRQFMPENKPQLKGLTETIALQNMIEKQTRLCQSLEKKVKTETQFNIQVQLNHELRDSKAKLDELLTKQNNE